MTALARHYGRLLGVCGLIAAALVAAMTALILADVALRNLFNAPIAASVELTEYTLFFAAAFAAPWLLRQGQHIRIDIAVTRLPPRAGWACEILCDLIGFALSLLLCWYAVMMVIRSVRSGTQLVKNLVFPEWWAMWPLPLMFLLIAVEFVFRLHRLLTGPRRARREGGSV